MNKHIIRGFMFIFIILLLHTGCKQNQKTNSDKVLKKEIPTSIVPFKDIQPPIATTLLEPDVMELGKPIKHSKKKKVGPELDKKDFEFIQTEQILLRPGQLNYPTSTSLHSQPTLAKPPKYGTNASDWKTVKGNYLQLTKKEGLEMINTDGIFQDNEGNIWGCSRWGGAWKYDGHQFIHYSKDSGLEDYSVVNLFFDRDGDVWFGMSLGVAKFDGSHFTHYTGEGEVSKNKPTKFAEDDYGNIWIGSMDGLYRLDKKQNTITHFTKENGLLDDEVNALYCDHSGRIWINYNQIGLSQLTIDKTSIGYKYQFSNYKTNDSSKFHHVQCLYENKKGQLFIGTDYGLIQIYSNEMDSNNTIRASLYIDPNITNGSVFIYTITEDHLGRLWIGTNHYLMQMNFDKNGMLNQTSIYKEADGILSNAVSGLGFDRENYLWTGHPVAGITKIDLNQSFRSISEDYGILGNVVGGLEDKWHNLWFSVRNRGLFCLKRSTDGDDEYLFEYNNEQNIMLDYIEDMDIDREGNIWIGGHNIKEGGTNLLKLEFSNEGNQAVVHHYTNDIGFSVGRLHDLMIDNEGAVWTSDNTLPLNDKNLMSEGGGVYKLVGNQLLYYGKDQGLMASDTYKMCQDKQGNFWFNSLYYGLTKFEPDGNNWIHYKAGDAQVRLLRHDTDGIWVNLIDGLHHFSSMVDTPSQEVKQFIIKGYEKDPSIISSFIKGLDKNTWVGDKKGIAKIKTNKEGDQTNSQPIYERFDKMDGLPVLNPNYMFQTSDSSIYLIAGTQFFSFLPSNLITEPKEKEVILHKVLVFDEDIKWEKEKQIILNDNKVLSNFTYDKLSKWTNVPQNLSLGYQDNYISFEYSTVEVSRPHKVKFRHFLKGYENRWNSASNNRKISYPNLPYGKYTLNISAKLGGGNWGSPLKYNFEIRPPWWLSWWAYALYVIFGVSLIYAFYQFQLNRNLEKAEASRLIELNEVKTRLYTNITHEFRTPLTVISGMTEQIKNNPKEWFSDGLTMIERNANRLLDLVNQMLDLNKLESGKINLKNQQSDILTYLKYIVESIHSFARGKNIKVHLLTEEENIIMDFDPENIQRVVMNLLSNALKFTPSEGDIYVSVSRIPSPVKQNRNDSMLQIKIKDTGVGIPENQIPFIFDRFYQVDGTSTRQGEGSGIGLALVKELIKLMRGEISVKSKLGKETIFTLLLPIQNTEKKIDLLAYPPKKEKTAFHGVAKIDEKTSREKKGNIQPVVESKPRILLIEDNADVVAYIASCLKDDYEIQVGCNGQEGLEIAFEHIPDLVITDVMMPIKDGFEVTKTLKQEELTSHIPIIMLTAKADMESKLSGLKKGADAYLSKPFHKEELLIRIKKLLELRKTLQKHYLLVAGSPMLKSTETPVVEDQFVIKLREVVESHVGDFDFTVEQFCKEVTMSSSQLHRKVTALTGLSPNKFIRYIRLNKARIMLKESDKPINMIAYETGFSDPSYFGRVFKKEFGMTPIEWRGEQ